MTKKYSKARQFSPLIRCLIIDECLQNQERKWTWEDLAEACGKQLRTQFNEQCPNPSERSIRADLARMRGGELGFKAPIQNIRESSRKKGYYIYTNPDFSIRKQPQAIQQIELLKASIQLLQKFNGFENILL